ncbi:hypothetical protein PROFUN_00141 [Planoprotostelium fungivorum]|uniref:Uncharacterized protein n=1 Tax=Planoprotostelium fungivorum TaxID=1890364 RepID=A0A2P6P0U1_9EUKA|nr:hypothetical protein PROFUN_00141 [Planoprotostelium fungivorum]
MAYGVGSLSEGWVFKSLRGHPFLTDILVIQEGNLHSRDGCTRGMSRILNNSTMNGPCHLNTLDTSPHNRPRLHPLVKAAWHMSNHDLFKAHRLIRGVQERPVAMWLHGILHRLEGDYSNTKCWIFDIELKEFEDFWKSKEEAYKYVDRVAMLRGLSDEKISETVSKTSERKKQKIPSYTEEELKNLRETSSMEREVEFGDRELDAALCCALKHYPGDSYDEAQIRSLIIPRKKLKRWTQ